MEAGPLDRQVFAANLKRVRETRHLSQKVLAERAGVSSEFISRMERGLTYPALPTFKLVCDALRTNPRELLYEYVPEPAELTQLIEDLLTVSLDRRKLIFEVMDSLITTYVHTDGKTTWSNLATAADMKAKA